MTVLSHIIQTISLLLLALVFFAILGIVSALSKKDKKKKKSTITITSLSKAYHDRELALRKKISASAAKKWLKTKKKHDKKHKPSDKPVLFVLDFQGDVKASATKQLRELIDVLLLIHHDTPCEVLLRIDSPGGMVNQYGFAAAQCQRLTKAGIDLTIAVDRVAASGGYMMACVANQILAAPFAVVGSIGVVFQLPNFHRYLDKHNIDIELLTAGNDKRNLTMLGKNTPADREKCQEHIEEIHTLFKEHVANERPQCNIERIATGRYWYGTQAFELRLVDKLITSDDYLMSKYNTHQLYHLALSTKKDWKKRLSDDGSALLQKAGQLLEHVSSNQLL